MYIQAMTVGNHKWIKTNLVEQNGRVHKFDLFRCSKCNMTGIKKVGQTNIEISEKHRLINVNICPESSIHKE